METTSFADRSCPLARAVDQVGPWWNLLILRNVFLGMHRFTELQANLGIAPTTLNRRLLQLCQDRILERQPYSAHPPRYEYHLTDKGCDLLPVVVALTTWGKDWLAPEGVALEAFDRETGEPVQAVLSDARTGRRIVAGSLRLRAGPAADERLRDLLKTEPVIPALRETYGCARTESNQRGVV